MKRTTWAYNGIFLGIILGITAGVASANFVIGIVVAIVASVGCFLAIRAIENLMYKGVEKAADAINKKIDESNHSKEAVKAVETGKRLCPFCGAENDSNARLCRSCNKELT